MSALGVHFLLEFSGCPAELINDAGHVERSLLQAAKIAEATIISHRFNTFNPHGVSGFVVIAESHLSIHTWPEHGYAALDIFTCGHLELTEIAAEYLRQAFRPSRCFSFKLQRGLHLDRDDDLLDWERSDDEARVISLVAAPSRPAPPGCARGIAATCLAAS